MFAVPGWAVSKKTPKLERTLAEQARKKRKRGVKDTGEAIDTTKIGELWTEHIQPKQTKEEKALAKKERKKLRRETAAEINGNDKELKLLDNGDGGSNEEVSNLNGAVEAEVKEDTHLEEVSIQPSSKKQKKSRTAEEATKTDGDTDEPKDAIAPESGPGTAEKGLSKKEKKLKRKASKDAESLSEPETNSNDKAVSTIAATQSKAAPKLTPLQASMRQKLISSRFRHLNETLYTTPSASSLELFKTNPEFFSEYHEGFRRQVEAWPENPVDNFLRWIRERGPVGMRNFKDIRRKTSKKPAAVIRQNDEEPLSTGPDSLPRDPRKGICTIADLGCGDGKLGAEITSTSLQKKLKLKVLSFDLASSAPHITVADIKSLPLEDGSADIAIFCLALMGTNWIDFIEEAYRILRWKGECWIAEVASRFVSAKQRRVEHSVGNRVKDKPRAKAKAPGSKPNDEDMEDLGFVADANAGPQNHTDVSEFVAVLRRRGFVLEGEPQTDNKMFVQMRFIKALPPRRGKGFRQQPREGKMKFIEEDNDEISVQEEAKMLKPCVYKLR